MGGGFGPPDGPSFSWSLTDRSPTRKFHFRLPQNYAEARQMAQRERARKPTRVTLLLPKRVAEDLHAAASFYAGRTRSSRTSYSDTVEELLYNSDLWRDCIKAFGPPKRTEK